MSTWANHIKFSSVTEWAGIKVCYGWEGSRGSQAVQPTERCLVRVTWTAVQPQQEYGSTSGSPGHKLLCHDFSKARKAKEEHKEQFFPEEEKKNREISRENVSVTLTTEAHRMAHPALCLAIVIPSGEWRIWEKGLLLCQPVWRKEKTQNRASQGPAGPCLSSLCLLAPRSTAQKPMMTHLPNHPCQAAGQRFGFAFSEHAGIVLESASRAKGKEGHTAFVPNPVPFLYTDRAALVNVHINVCYIYREFMCQ